jgi:hypothetical protein
MDSSRQQEVMGENFSSCDSTQLVQLSELQLAAVAGGVADVTLS